MRTRVLAAWILAGVASMAAWAQQAVTVTYTYSGLPLPIFTDSADVISVAEIVIPRAIRMTKVTAQVNLQYPNTGDLRVYLYSPQGTRTILMEHNCSIANVDTTFDDAAPTAWKDFCPTEAGRGPFRGDQPLSNFNSDTSSFGIWRLAVDNDVSNSRSGWINSFSLTIAGTTQVNPTTSSRTIVNAASLGYGGMIAPGELTSIFGSGLGPALGVAAPAGAAFPTSLAGTTVTLNGTPVPLAYVSTVRVDFQAPIGISPGSTVTLQVASSTQNSGPVTVTVQDSAPGVYANSANGAGPVKAINQTGTANSRSAPAPKGSVIVVYASGLGTTMPPLSEGSVPPSSPLYNATGNIGAFIGGAPATVLFAGMAPTFPGIYQLNLQVPMNAPSGTQELLIYANGRSSQKDATLEIQ